MATETKLVSTGDQKAQVGVDMRSQREQRLPYIIEKAHAVCADRQVNFTLLRKQILTIIWLSEHPQGAYSIMAALEKCSDRDVVAPPTVYRTLAFLVEHGLIHRIHSLNAYIGRAKPETNNCETLFICKYCGSAEETPNNSIQQSINLHANEKRFTVEQQALEILGLCEGCKNG